MAPRPGPAGGAAHGRGRGPGLPRGRALAQLGRLGALGGPDGERAGPGAPDPDDFRRVQDAAGGTVRIVSCAPEFPRALPFIETLSRAGVIPSLGHTTAGPDLVRDAIRAGVRHATHTFNGMQPMHHRDPGRPRWCAPIPGWWRN